MLREAALNFLKDRNPKAGETVQFGWNIFRILEHGGEIDLETLDFQDTGSFTRDFTIPERIHWAQHETLQRLNLKDGVLCNLRDSALVTKSFTPGSSDIFMERSHPNAGNDSGWYIGIMDDPLDMDDHGSFDLCSLYELTISDDRLARFWLLPVGFRVFLTGDNPIVEQVAAGNDR